MSRRNLLAGASALSWLWATRPGEAVPPPVSDRLSIADTVDLHRLDQSQQQAHLDVFRRLGFGILRTSVSQRGFDPLRADIQHHERLDYVRMAVRSGYRLKLQVGGWSGVPDTFEREHPDAKIVNRRGESPPPGYLSPWYPGLRALLAAETQTAFNYLQVNNLLGAVATFIVDLGPAGEPIYPAGWVMRQRPEDGTFWFYDVHAQAAFGRDMQQKYGNDLRRANSEWTTRFADWSQVQIPEPKTKPGPMWRDVLLWYRDAKRAIVRFQIETCAAMVARYYRGIAAPQMLVLLPGSHLPPGAIERAAEEGEGGYAIKLMTDTDWLIDQAHSHGCAAQYTGAENETEIRYIEEYIRAHGYDLPLWAENAGGRPALDPGHLADVVLRNGLFGLDYVNAGAVLQADGVTPNAVMPQLAEACARLLQRLPTRPGR